MASHRLTFRNLYDDGVLDRPVEELDDDLSRLEFEVHDPPCHAFTRNPYVFAWWVATHGQESVSRLRAGRWSRAELDDRLRERFAGPNKYAPFTDHITSGRGVGQFVCARTHRRAAFRRHPTWRLRTRYRKDSVHEHRTDSVQSGHSGILSRVRQTSPRLATQIRFILTRHEQGAVFMAEIYGLDLRHEVLLGHGRPDVFRAIGIEWFEPLVVGVP